MKTKTKKDCRPTCSECGGTNVEDTAWIAYRKDGSAYVVNGEGPIDGSEGSTWCHDCEEHHDLVYPYVVGGLESDAARYRDRQRNDAAREHGPELLAALVALLDEADLGEVDEDTRPIVEAARSVISKVTKGGW